MTDLRATTRGMYRGSGLVEGQSSHDNAEVQTAYLDNCIVPSGVIKNQLPPKEAAALRELERRRAAREVALYTSHVTKEEIAKTPAEHRQPLDDLYEMYENVPAMEEEFQMPGRLGSLRSGSRSGPIVRDEILGRLLSILPDELDARHIFQAAKNGVDYFVTRDEKTILKYADEIRSAARIQVLLPTELLQSLDTSSRSE